MVYVKVSLYSKLISGKNNWANQTVMTNKILKNSIFDPKSIPGHSIIT